MIGLLALATETLTSVVPQTARGNEFNGWLFWPLVAVGALVIVLIIWHRKNPTAESKSQQEALALAKAEIEHLRGLLAHMLSPSTAAPAPVAPTPAPVAAAPATEEDLLAATAADVANPTAYFWRIGESLGYSGVKLSEYVSGCNFLVAGSAVTVQILTDVAKKLAAEVT